MLRITTPEAAHVQEGHSKHKEDTCGCMSDALHHVNQCIVVQKHAMIAILGLSPSACKPQARGGLISPCTPKGTTGKTVRALRRGHSMEVDDNTTRSSACTASRRASRAWCHAQNLCSSRLFTKVRSQCWCQTQPHNQSSAPLCGCWTQVHIRSSAEMCFMKTNSHHPRVTEFDTFQEESSRSVVMRGSPA